MATAVVSDSTSSPEFPKQQAFFLEDGYLQWNNLLTKDEVAELIKIYDQFLDGTLDVKKHRYDLGSAVAPKHKDKENITQIMWPSDILPALRDHPMRQRALDLVRKLYSDETFDFDFDMLICKYPHTDTPTFAHSDEAYWCPLTDKRAVSMWIALDESTIDNGCMWYGPKTHLDKLRPHRRSGENANSALMCDATEDEMRPMPLQPGSAGLHAGRTVHYSRGNTTDTMRRAYILNFRPRAMIEAERAVGFDHGRAGNKVHEVRSKEGDGPGHGTDDHESSSNSSSSTN